MDNFDLRKYLAENKLLKEENQLLQNTGDSAQEAFDYYLTSWAEGFGSSGYDFDVLYDGPTPGSKIDTQTWEKDEYYFTDHEKTENMYNNMVDYLKTNGSYIIEKDLDAVGKNAKITYTLGDNGSIEMEIYYSPEYLEAVYSKEY